MLVLTGLLTAVAARAMLLKFSVLDLDIWWHLKVGDWIIEHHAVSSHRNSFAHGRQSSVGRLQLGL